MECSDCPHCKFCYPQDFLNDEDNGDFHPELRAYHGGEDGRYTMNMSDDVTHLSMSQWTWRGLGIGNKVVQQKSMKLPVYPVHNTECVQLCMVTSPELVEMI